MIRLKRNGVYEGHAQRQWRQHHEDTRLFLSAALSRGIQSYTQFVFDRFSEQARRVLYLARVEVSRCGSPQIEPEHVLLGIIREGKGSTYELLFEEFQLDWRALAAQSIEARLEKKPRFDTSVEIPFSRSAKEVLTATAEEAEQLQHREIGTREKL